MWRSILFIKAALALASPTMTDGLQAQYAEILQRESVKRGLDPVELVALVENESHWDASRVGGVGQHCIGLGQHCLHTLAVCRDTAYRGDLCQAEWDALLVGEYNLRATAALVSEKIAACSRRTRRPVTFRRWVTSYQGFGSRCGMVHTRRGWVDGPMRAQTAKIVARAAEFVRIVGARKP